MTGHISTYNEKDQFVSLKSWPSIMLSRLSHDILHRNLRLDPSIRKRYASVFIHSTLGEIVSKRHKRCLPENERRERRLITINAIKDTQRQVHKAFKNRAMSNLRRRKGKLYCSKMIVLKKPVAMIFSISFTYCLSVIHHTLN